MMAGAANLNVQMHEHSAEKSLQPSILDVLGEESLMAGLKPAARFLFKFVSSVYNAHSSKWVLRHFDEVYVLFETLLQNYYLKHFSASYSENFYGLKRVLKQSRQNLSLLRDRLKSLSFLVFLPFIKSKLDAFLEKLNDNPQLIEESTGLRKWVLKKLTHLYPRIRACLEFWTLCLQVGYLLGKSDTHSPWLQMAGVVLQNSNGDGDEFSTACKAESGKRASALSSVKDRLFGWMSKSLGIVLLFVQFLEWWESSERDKKITVTLPVPDPPHGMFLNESTVSSIRPGQCPLCKGERRIDTVLAVSGYVFCYECILNHVKRKHYCPVTKVPATTGQLIRIFTAKPT